MIFIQNKYHDLYYSIINKAKSEKREKGKGVYYERHHIIPKSMGGSNDATNLVLLTAREHFICHMLLYKITKGTYKRKMLCAFNAMCTFNSNRFQSRLTVQKLNLKNSRLYEHLREEYIKINGKPCKIISPSGTVVRAHSIKELHRKINEVIHIRQLRNLVHCNRREFQGWRSYDELQLNKPHKCSKKIYRFINPQGEVIEGHSILSIANKCGIYYHTLYQIHHGKKENKGWRKYDKSLIGQPKIHNTNTYQFISPSGKIYTTKSMRALAIKLGFNPSFFGPLSVNPNRTINGWQLYTKGDIVGEFKPTTHVIVDHKLNKTYTGKNKSELLNSYKGAEPMYKIQKMVTGKLCIPGYHYKVIKEHRVIS